MWNDSCPGSLPGPTIYGYVLAGIPNRLTSIYLPEVGSEFDQLTAWSVVLCCPWCTLLGGLTVLSAPCGGSLGSPPNVRRRRCRRPDRARTKVSLSAHLTNVLRCPVGMTQPTLLLCLDAATFAVVLACLGGSRDRWADVRPDGRLCRRRPASFVFRIGG